MGNCANLTPRKHDLFSVFSDSVCIEYENVRDEKNSRCVQTKRHCEDLWTDYQEYADRHFIREFSRDSCKFHERWFEMYFSVSLLRRGMQIESTNVGPDIALDMDGRRIWIEAVCANAGKAGRPDSVPSRPAGQVFDVPVREYVLRIRNSLEYKAKKFKKYKKEGIVCEQDILAIAINIYGIDGIMPNVDDVVMRALYGLGDMELKIDKYTKELKSISHQSITTIHKRSGSPVGTIPFVDDSMDYISSALVFWSNAANLPKKLGDDCVLYPNLSCRNSLPQGVISMGREWRFTEYEDGWQGSPIDYLDC